MHISLTGNPFVDTGLAVLASKSNCESIEELTLEKIKAVHDGNELACRNSNFKSTFGIFTTNGLLTNPAIKPVEKRIQFYSAMVTAFLNKIGYEDYPERCESCGNPTSLDIDRVIAETIVPLGYKKDDVRYTGRDWFPLAGSIGSDAQALPAASRSPNLCAKCLFSVHYLPQGVILREGKLAVFQSTSPAFWYKFVKPIAVEIDKRVMANKFETLGSKEGSVTVIKKTFEAMHDLKQMGPGISLFMWLFSNSGQGPDCKIEEIPNSALQFLFKAYVSGYKNDILNLVSKDGSSENSFLYYISTGKDCFRLYPNKKYAGVPPELFMFYQTEICKTQKYSLLIAHKIAQRLRKCESDNKKYEAICKEINTDLAVKRKIKKIIVEMIEDGSLNYSEYVALFADDSVNRIDTKSNVWKYISYFAYNADWVSSESLTYTALPSMLQYVARQIFERCIAEKSVAWFKEKVLDKFTIGKISVPWLRRQFLKCASNNECFNYSTWKSLSSGENGRENFVEALYRFRLLWTEWLRTNNISDNLEMPKLQSQTDALDLPLNVKTAVYTIVNDYLCQRGRERFEKDVIAKLITGEKSFLWFKQKLVALNKDYYDEHFWDTFLADDVGYSIVSIRLFQLSLELMNSYRQHVFKPDKL